MPRPLAKDLVDAVAADRAHALAGHDVSRETLERLDAFVALFLERQETQNLVAASTVSQVWSRHIIDSLQLRNALPDAKTWIDLGSGAGFPGLVLACALAGTPNARVDLIESHQRKAAFLTDVVQRLALPALVHVGRIEDILPHWGEVPDAVTARALAPLEKLLSWTAPLIKKGAKGVFPKGQHVGLELTEASKSWRIQAQRLPSVTHPDAAILVVEAASRRTKS
ncbi:MAG: 16S rRNA (guanine(527)-N(7))-methyltransferase RsmG [Variibacter sp.]